MCPKRCVFSFFLWSTVTCWLLSRRLLSIQWAYGTRNFTVRLLCVPLTIDYIHWIKNGRPGILIYPGHDRIHAAIVFFRFFLYFLVHAIAVARTSQMRSIALQQKYMYANGIMWINIFGSVKGHRGICDLKDNEHLTFSDEISAQSQLLNLLVNFPYPFLHWFQNSPYHCHFVFIQYYYNSLYSIAIFLHLLDCDRFKTLLRMY